MSRALPFLLASPGVVAIPAIAYAQQAPSAAEAQAALNPPPAQSFSQGQLDQMLAPIALFPDQVLMQVLMAATFPQQVIDAGQWLQDPNNANLHGDALASALEPLPWDPSVKSLIAFPQIIVMMNDHMDWTQALGVAFGGQQVAVMAEVQTLRNRAAAANQFHSNGQIRYVHSGGFWVIEPVNPGEVYIPVYNPAVVYGRWAYPDYPPIYVPPPPGFVGAGFNLGPGIAFSVGFGVVAPLWGWGHPDWGQHSFVVDPARYNRITTTGHSEANHVAIQGGAWHRTAPVTPVPVPRRTEPTGGPQPHGTAPPSSIPPRPAPPHPGPTPEPHPGPAPTPHPAPPPEPHPGPAPTPHPAPPPEPHPGPAPTPHPAPPPEPHPAPPPAPHPAPPPEPHPAPPPAPHPAPPPEPHPAPPPAPHPAPPPEPHPAPPPAPHPAPPPEPHPAPPPAPHPAPAPEPHPAPAPAPHPAPAPEPAAHPAPPPHPAPEAKPEEKKPDEPPK